MARSDVQDQYAHGALLEAIDSALDAAHGQSENPTLEDLAPVDGFHIRGREATRELLEHLSLPSGPSVLDVGCGIGGTARYLAREYGADVLGVDLSEEYCRVARDLTQRVQLDDRVRFQQGDAVDLPVEGRRFDLVVSEHVQMNVPDKERYVGEIRRVLRPGGLFAAHEIFSSGEGECHYPVPWADEPTVSFLISPEHFRQLLIDAGLELQEWKDRSDESLAWFQNTLEKVKREGPPPLGLHVLMGSAAREKMKNVVRNLAEEKIAVVSAVARKPA